MSAHDNFLFEPTPDTEAMAFIAGKAPLSKEVFARLLPELKARAFTISGVQSFDVMQRVRDEIATLPMGGDWNEIKKKVVEEIHPYVADPEDPENTKAAERSAETLLRTHGFQAYSAGSYRAMEEQKDVFTYWQYHSMGDSRVRPSHGALNGIVLPADSPFWQGHYPPWEWNCRCQVVPLLPEEVEEMRKKEAKMPVEKRNVLEGETLRQVVDNHMLHRGPDQVYDLRNPAEKGESNGYSWQPGDLRITPGMIQARYDHVTWNAFEMWARKTSMGEGGQTIWDWMNGQGDTPFKQPVLRKMDGPGKINVPDPFFKRVKDRMGLGAVHIGPSEVLAGIAAAEVTEILSAEKGIIGRRPEAGMLYSSTGKPLWEGRGETLPDGTESILPEGNRKGAIFTHNHPSETPPSRQDVENFFLYGMKEVRVVTKEGTYSIAPGVFSPTEANYQRLASHSIDILPLIRASVGELQRANNLSDTEATVLHFRSLWEEAASEGYITFVFTPNFTHEKDPAK